jgi:multicomponent Na+:H+ antiporter subunit G
MLEAIVTVLIVLSLGFFAAGTVGVLRFPDVYMRLHAITKADNVGLGLLVLALAIAAPDPRRAALLILIWLLVLMASTTACHLVARNALRRGIVPWQRSR